MNLLNKTILDDRTIRVDWDAGIFDGRQFGRGETGGQWRDDFRQDFDEARGGQGRNLLRKVAGNPDQQVRWCLPCHSPLLFALPHLAVHIASLFVRV